MHFTGFLHMVPHSLSTGLVSRGHCEGRKGSLAGFAYPCILVLYCTKAGHPLAQYLEVMHRSISPQFLSSLTTILSVDIQINHRSDGSSARLHLSLSLKGAFLVGPFSDVFSLTINQPEQQLARFIYLGHILHDEPSFVHYLGPEYERGHDIR